MMIAARMRTVIPLARLSQSGERTHHQLHAMTPVSLSVIKMRVRSPAKPMLPDEELLESDMILILVD